jgi:hypothetical protein
MMPTQNTKAKFIQANSALLANSSAKTRSKSVDIRSSLNGGLHQRPVLQNAALLNTVNSFGLDTVSSSNQQQRRRIARVYYQDPLESHLKSQEFRQLEAKNQLERDRLSQIMQKLEKDLLNAKKELQEEEDEETGLLLFDEEKYKRQISSSSSLSTSGVVVSASSCASSTSPSIHPPLLTQTNATNQENFYDNNNDYKDVSPLRGRAAQKNKKTTAPLRRHSIGVLLTSGQTVKEDQEEVTAENNRRHLEYISENPELMAFLKQSKNANAVLRSSYLTSKSVSNLPANKNGEITDVRYHQATLTGNMARKGNAAGYRLLMDQTSKINEEEMKRTIENLSPLSISASSVSSSANSSPATTLPRISKTVSNTLVTQIADEVGSIGRTFNRISSSNMINQNSSNETAVVADSEANIEDGYKISSKLKFESFI